MTETIATAQPEALRLADELDEEAGRITQYTNRPGDLLRELAATELRRLHAALATAEARNATLTDDAARELIEIARDIEALKRECGMDPESPIAIQNGRYMALSYKVRALAATKGDANGH